MKIQAHVPLAVWFCLIALAVAGMLIAQGPLLSQHLHGLLDSKFNRLEGFAFHARFKF